MLSGLGFRIYGIRAKGLDIISFSSPFGVLVFSQDVPLHSAG